MRCSYILSFQAVFYKANWLFRFSIRYLWPVFLVFQILFAGLAHYLYKKVGNLTLLWYNKGNSAGSLCPFAAGKAFRWNAQPRMYNGNGEWKHALGRFGGLHSRGLGRIDGT